MFNWFGKKTDTPQAEREAKTAPSGFGRLKSALSGTGQSLVGKIVGALSGSHLDDNIIDDIEEILIRADVGLDVATDITDKLRKKQSQLKTTDDVMAFLKTEFSSILTPFESANHLNYTPGVMNIYLVVGVNGAGKTTFIGKLANQFVKDNKKVIIGAGDTFRAAAQEQLEVWAQRAGAGFITAQAQNSDPAAVMFDAINMAKAQGAEVVLLDTAGRLQNKFNLMEELQKIRRVIDKEMPDNATLECLLVLDATTGQNALKQAEVFKEAVNINGVVLTKLDGSAKGGVILNIAKSYNLPVKMIGVGEGIEDLRPFDATTFIEALFTGYLSHV